MKTIRLSPIVRRITANNSNMFTGPGKVDRGLIEPLPRKQTLEELSENLLICTPTQFFS